ncbi:MAG TPA: hypothetical protein VF033_08075 [Steroidobacteraceae bacterium]
MDAHEPFAEVALEVGERAADDVRVPPDVQAGVVAGRLYPVDVGRERRKNAFGLMMSLNMLIEFGDAFDFTGADFWGWCREAGFRRYETLHLAGPCSAAIAYK